MGRVEPRRAAVLDEIGRLESGDGLAVASHLLDAFRCFKKRDVGARIRERLGAPERLVEAVGRVGIGAGHEQHVEPALFARADAGPNPSERFAPFDDRLAGRVAAALGPGLILDHDTREARLRAAEEGALGIHGVAVAGVGISDDRKRGGGTHVSRLVEHLAVAHEPDVG